MATSAFFKFNNFAELVANKQVDLFGTTDTLKVFLTNTTPNAATMTVKTDLTDLPTTGGYTAGGEDTQNDSTRTLGVVTVTAVDITWTSTGAGFGPFRYAILYDDTATNDEVLGWWDYGSAITPAGGETFKTDFGASILTVTAV